MMAAVRLVEYLVNRQLPLSEVVRTLPPMHIARLPVSCPWEAKGKVMRLLNHQYKHHPVENIDGLKIHLNETEWIHLSPNPDKPRFEVVAEGDSCEQAQALVEEYGQQIQKFLESETN
jgi:mannose-1-phosphate guanylyltransferase/phosphomannomutase